MRVLRAFALLVIAMLLVAAAALAVVVIRGVSARPPPSAAEAFLARRVRSMAIGGQARSLSNPVQQTSQAVADGRAHFADHCAVCHANDGSGDTETGRGLWPRPPDLRQALTQKLSDGELFYIIENGVRLTGMPAFGTGTPESQDASWRLVHFIRHLPSITPEEIEEMESLNPKPAEEWRQEMETRRFLDGGDPAPGDRRQ
jgi:mono/diheme cytochrome c family protein